MIQLSPDIWFIVAGWGVILGGLALYAVALLRRLAAARRAAAGTPTTEDETPHGGRG
jgi:hypothetical protein